MKKIVAIDDLSFPLWQVKLILNLIILRKDEIIIDPVGICLV